MYVKTSVHELPLAGLVRFTLIAMLLSLGALFIYEILDEGILSKIALGITTFMAGVVASFFIPAFRIKKKYLRK